MLDESIMLNPSVYIYISIVYPNEPCSKCLVSWHQIRKCLRRCLRVAYAHTGFAYTDILSYTELMLVYAHQSFAYATPLPGAASQT